MIFRKVTYNIGESNNAAENITNTNNFISLGKSFAIGKYSKIATKIPIPIIVNPTSNSAGMVL